MSTTVTSPADMVNLALARMGSSGRVGSLYDGSAIAKKALDVYAATRDDMLRDSDYGFSERNIAMQVVKQAPAAGYMAPDTIWNPAKHPSQGWLFAYAYPDDCIKIRGIRPSNVQAVNLFPKPHVWKVENDNTTNPPSKVIVTNVANALLTYTGRVTDPQLWDSAFVDAFAAALGRRLAPVVQGKDAAQAEVADEGASTVKARSEEG